MYRSNMEQWHVNGLQRFTTRAGEHLVALTTKENREVDGGTVLEAVTQLSRVTRFGSHHT